MTGQITSATAALAAGNSESLTLTNSRITTASIVLVSVVTGCTGGITTVTGATSSAGSATIVVYNAAAATACSSTYVLGFLVLDSS
jgi:hypothetical protein